MLVVTRHSGEGIWIGDNIRVIVGRVQGDGRVRIAIQAPDEIKILRDELFEQEHQLPLPVVRAA